MINVHSKDSQEKLSYTHLEWTDQDDDFANPETGSGSEFDALFKDQSENGLLKEGQVVKGRIMGVRSESVLVDIGHKSAGEVSKAEFSNAESLKVGDEVDVFIEVFEDEDGQLVLSKDKADMLKAWDRIALAFENNELVHGTITGRVKGGLSVDIGVKAFLPGSQVDLRPVRNLEKLLGQNLEFKIIKFNKKRGNIVLSRRALLEQDREKQRSQTLQSLDVGAVMMGVVKNITDYGAFVDLGGIDGLLHITDMSWGRLTNPSEMVNVGDRIEVKIISYDAPTQRVSLGMKQLQADPWVAAVQKYQPEQKLNGKVISLTDYGAFVELEPGVEGLIHVTEMTWNRRVKHPSKVVNVGDEVEVIVLAIDQENHRISLGMKQVEANPWELVVQKYQVGDVIRGRIRNITDFGLFVGIEDGVDGLIHISDISWTQRNHNLPEQYKKNDEVEAKVLQIDSENMRFSLGIKQLTGDPLELAAQRFPTGYEGTAKVLAVLEEKGGAILELEAGVEGYMSQNQLDSGGIKPKVGDSVDFVVNRISFNDRRFDLFFPKSQK